MNLIFDRNTLKVISSFDNKLPIKSETEVLKQMFPTNYDNLSLWQIDKTINCRLMYLNVTLDSEKNPEILKYKGKEIYRRSEEDKKRIQAKKLEEGRKVLSQILPRTLRSSIGFDIIKMWSNSPYTYPSVVQSLKDLSYFSDKKIIPVCWGGPFTDAGGYANMNREIIFRLHNYHIIPKAEVWPTAPQVSSSASYYITKYSHFDMRKVKRFTRIHGFTPHPIAPHNGRTVFFTMMETETLHPELTRICNGYSDEIWVPSQHNKRVFAEFGVKKPIQVMPLGIDANLYKNESSPLGVINDTNCFVNLLGRPCGEGVRKFRFLTLFGWSYRKGIDVLIKSFVKEFTNADDVALIICSRHAGSPDPAHQHVIQAETMRFAKEVRLDRHPQILLYPHIIPEKQMPDIYRMGHAFVHFSRGEGFSLPQIEASAVGLPVISCNNTGMSEYLTDDNAFLVKTEEKEICSPEMHWISGFYHGQLFPKLGDDQINQAVNHMRYVVNNYSKALEKGQKLRQLVFDKYTWDKATERVAKRIEEINKLSFG